MDDDTQGNMHQTFVYMDLFKEYHSITSWEIINEPGFVVLDPDDDVKNSEETSREVSNSFITFLIYI